MTLEERLAQINAEIVRNVDTFEILQARREAARTLPVPLTTLHPMLVEAGLAQKKLTLVAQGDSWFDYPLGWDIVEVLQNKYGHDVKDIAQYGSTLNDIVYNPFEKQNRVAELFYWIGQKKPDAVLLSGGGNDIAGDGFFFSFINNLNSDSPGANQGVIDAVVNGTFRDGYSQLIQSIQAAFPGLRVFVHGYDYPWPDGRPAKVVGDIWTVGPWFNDTFDLKNFPYNEDDAMASQELKWRRTATAVFIDTFNKMLAGLQTDFPGMVYYVDLRGTLGAIDCDQSFRLKYWANELHPNNDGFALIADKFNLRLNAVL